MQTITDAKSQVMTDVRNRRRLPSVAGLEIGDIVINQFGLAFKVIGRNKQTLTVKGIGFQKLGGALVPYAGRLRQLTTPRVKATAYWQITKGEAMILLLGRREYWHSNRRIQNEQGKRRWNW